MKLKDAISSLQLFQKKENPHRLTTAWGERLDSEHVWEKYPRPQLQRDGWINLNGYWNYKITKDKKYPKGLDDKGLNGQILVPFSPEAALSQVSHILPPDEYLWYEKDFQVEGFSECMQEHQRLILHFGAVDQTCAVWCNKKYVRSHRGGYLPFEADLTPYLSGGSNTITVRVQDETDTACESRGKQTLQPGGMFYTSQSGIWQTVWLEWVPENYVRSLFITPLFDEARVKIELVISGSRKCEKNIEIYAGDKRVYNGTTPSDSLTVQLEEIHPWSPESPFLYDVIITAGKDKVRSYFAMRKFSTEIDEKGIPRLCLNNEPYFQNGVLDQGYWPDGLYTAPSDEAMIYDIQSMKDLGFNMIRKHIKVEPLRWYYHCDRLGMIVWQDMVNGGGRSFLTFLCYLPTLLPFVTARFKDNHYRLFSRTDSTAKKQWLKECRETIRHLYNCPCIGLWTAFNEGWGQFDAIKVTNMIRSMDSTRMIDHASGWYDQHCGDVKSVHNYFRPLEITMDSRPYVLSEYGGFICRIPNHSYSNKVYGYLKCDDPKDFTDKFKKLMEDIRKAQKDGLCAAVYTQVSDVEEEVNGLYTYDRKVCKLVDEA